MEFSESISISQSPEKIWGFWLLVSTDVQWRNGMTKAEWTSQPPYGVGSTGIHYQKNIGALPWTIIKHEEGRHTEWVFGECRLKNSIGSYHVEAEEGGSRVTLNATFPQTFMMRLMVLFMGGKIKQGIKDDLQKLKEIMEK